MSKDGNVQNNDIFEMAKNKISALLLVFISKF
jgi:hypothetical protein